MTRSSMSLLDRLLFRDKGILPSKRLLYIMAAVSVALFVTTFWGMPWPVVFAVNGVALLISLADLMFVPRHQDVTVTRLFPEELERGKLYTVELNVVNASSRAVNFRLIDGLPQSFARPFPIRGEVDEHGSARVVYETSSPERGRYAVDKVYLRYTSRTGLWEKQKTLDLYEDVKVVPDLTDTKRYLESAQRFLLHEGVQIRRQYSGVGEFAKIRHYVPGDDPRKINWRQTAKLQEVMTNEYEPEHGKYVTILIDCGRMMGAELKKANRLERSLEAALTVAAAALDKGDYVAVAAFSKDVNVYVPPAKGKSHLRKIINAVYHLQADEVESNYAAVLNYLQTVQKKRSFMLLFTDVRTFLHEESALVYLKRLRQRHLFFMIGIEDYVLKERADQKPEDVKTAMVKSMAQNQFHIKQREKTAWEQQGLQMIEAEEDHLASAAVSQYIQLMNRGML